MDETKDTEQGKFSIYSQMRRVTYVFDEDASAASADAITLRKYAVVFYMVPLADIAPFPDFLVVVYLASEDATGDFVVIVIANAAIVAAVVVIVEPTSIQDKNVFPFLSYYFYI